jgi:hypothetical protein
MISTQSKVAGIDPFPAFGRGYRAIIVDDCATIHDFSVPVRRRRGVMAFGPRLAAR